MKGRDAARLAALAAALLFAAACVPRTMPPAAPGAAGATPSAPRLPAVPARSGALAIDAVYPSENAALTSADSAFVFGSVGTGGATLTINGAPVPVAPNGAWLAYLPVPADGVYRLAASAAGQTATLERRVRVPAAAPMPSSGLAIVRGSITPRGAMTVLPGERIEVRFRGTPSAEARLRLPDGTVVPLAEQPVVERAEGFMLDRQTAARGVAEYAGAFAADAPLLAKDTAVAAPSLAALPAAAGHATLELIRGRDTVRAPLPASVALLAGGAPRTAVAATAREDGTVIATAVAGGNTPYHWFFPNRTRLALTGERGGEYRVRLTSELSVWVPAGDVRLLAPGLPAPHGSVGTVRAVPAADYVDLRLSTSERLPFRVDGSERGLTITVYGAETR
ncbi:MAG TPA: hypothetical protein VFX29_06345, partial [Longimicrobiaceae bacterium]|nr:hypothetical protein [Longimicrobiaceae bacterium]